MTGLFSKPKVPPTPKPSADTAPPPVPTIDDTRQRITEGDAMRLRRGRAAAMLTGQRGDMSTSTVGTKTLLGM